MEKVIRDPVHGYIHVPADLCRLFIDTPIFQRLRSIEQTSMRWLFPGGRHDRFVHSLGVFHLARKMYEGILRNVKDEEVKAFLNQERIQNTFWVAALMHDCGHAPFSHTTEHLYNEFASGKAHNRTYLALQQKVAGADEDDFNFQGIRKKPADHEAMSAYVLLSQYGDALGSFGVDSVLAARMITGVKYRHPQNIEQEICNVLVQLINGDAIDVDKLDYVVRDTWASGVKNTAIDVGRLLDAATIAKDDDDGKIRFSYNASALSVIQTVIDARNYLYEWIYGHHTVVYYAELLKQLCGKLGEALGGETGADDVLARLFSTAIFSGSEPLHSAKGAFLQTFLNDGDLMYLFKQHCSAEKAYLSYTSHVPVHVPLWKTEAEFRFLVHSDIHKTFDPKLCVDELRKRFDLSTEDCFSCKGMSGKIYDIEPSAVKIQMRKGKVRSYCDVANVTRHPTIEDAVNPFSYIYIGKGHSSRHHEVLRFINDYQWG